MKIFKKKGFWFGTEDQAMHLVEDREWTGGGNQMLTLMTISTFCKKKAPLSKGDLYDDYNKKTHRRQICEECITNLKQAIALRAPKA